MDVVSTCPLRVASIMWQRAAEAWTLAVVCKATFRLEPDMCRLVAPQEAPANDDGYWDDNGTGSLRLPSDLVPFKAHTDVLLVGPTFAPQGQSVRSLLARFTVGTVDKVIEVWCDRSFGRDGRLLEGPPFARMPLRYERAAGGPGTSNPVGMRFDAPPDATGAVPVPNLQPPGIGVLRSGHTFAPIAFGPIAPDWPERVEELGRHAAGWSHRTWNERPLHRDLAAYFNTAPRDQLMDAIEPDELIVLENLHPEHPRLETRLPGVRPRARMSDCGRAGEEVRLTGDTLYIDTDRRLVTVVWRGRVPLLHAGEAGHVVVSMEGPATGDLGPGSEGRRRRAAETEFGGREVGPALPFGPAKSPWAGSPPVSTPALVPTPTGTLFEVRENTREVLPFPVASRSAGVPADSDSSVPAPVAAGDAGDGPVMGPQATALPDVAPPPMIGPLATAEMAVKVVEAAPAKVEEEEVAVAAPKVEKGLPLDEFPIERCAAIAASLARRKIDRAQVLGDNELEPTLWNRLDQHWNQEIQAEICQGKTGLLHAHDMAYVGQLEKERGAISLEEYARLLVAVERGTLYEALEEMTLPMEATIRIERVWLRRIAYDAAFGKSARRAVKAARER
jgi:hypothetical protein